MPYGSNSDLPVAVKEHLPDHAQTIYREAFNNALQQYQNEESGHRVAWAAVKKQYEKNSAGQWIKKGDGEDA